MISFILIGFTAVLVNKYYTSVQIQHLERRVRGLRDDVKGYRQRLNEIQVKLNGIHRDEQSIKEQLCFTSDLIEDLNFRLTEREPDSPSVGVLAG
tara:strand:- start:35 stop:319 length:285 start_codon:yes stop_codon:yes gene_type:complete